MSNFNQILGSFVPPKGKIAIVASRFNEIVVERLEKGATDELVRHGVNIEKIDLIRVPGAFEIPLTCLKAAQSGVYDGIIALGTIIRGATAHFDYVASNCASGIMQAQMQTNIPIMFGVLTTDTIEQATERAGCKAGNKGSEAAVALLETINTLHKLHQNEVYKSQ